MTSSYYNREYEILIDGTTVIDQYFRMVFDITVDTLGLICYADIAVYNLSTDTKNKIRNGETITLKAGYSDNVDVIYSGNIINCFDEREGPSTILRVISRSGNNTTATINKSFGSGTDVVTLIKACGTALGLPVQITESDFSSETTYIGGYAMAGDPRVYLDNLSDIHAFGYAIDRGKVVVTKDGTTENRQEVTISQQTGMVGIPEITEIGCTVDLRITPTLRVGDKITIDAGLATFNFNGTFFRDVPDSVGTGSYNVLRLQYTGDTHGDDWTMRIEGTRPEATVSR